MIATKLKIASPHNGQPIHCLLTEPVETSRPKGIVQFAHGMCEHKERYVPFMEFLSSNAYVCIINDHRGHGVSAPELGFMGKNGWMDLIDDTLAVGAWARERYPDVPLHLFGHSMGSMVVRGAIKKSDKGISSLFVCGCPSDNPARGAGMVLVSLIGLLRGWHFRSPLLQKIMFGTFNKGFEADGCPSAWICSDKAVLKAYHADPLCQYVFTADGFLNLLKLMAFCYSPKGWNVSSPELPVHFISGAEDPCRISEEALGKAADLMKAVGYSRTDLKLYPGMRHEILNETDKQTVWKDVLHTLS